MKKLAMLLAGWMLLGSAPIAMAQHVESSDISPRGYVCPQAKGGIKIDGRIEEAEWGNAPWSEEFIDIEGDRRPRPTFSTRMKMQWDDRGLYIAADLKEPHVWGTLKEHDSVIFRDPDFEVFLDPDGDAHLYGELELNALNTTWDLLLNMPYKDGGKAVNAWEIKGLETAVHITGTINDPSDNDMGWSVEMLLPWTSLKELADVNIPPKDGDQWRINFSRVEWDITHGGGRYEKVPNRPEHNWVWSPQGLIDMHRPEHWGILQFSTANDTSAALKPDPSRGPRRLLQQVYEAETKLFKEAGRYSTNAEDLGLRAKLPEGLMNLKIEVTSRGFEATVETLEPAARWSIRENSRFLRH